MTESGHHWVMRTNQRLPINRAAIAGDMTKSVYMPINRAVIVEDMEAKDRKTEGGVVIPDTSRHGRYQEGRVIAVSPGLLTRDDLEIRVGMIVGSLVNHGDVFYDDNGKVLRRLSVDSLHVIRVEDR